MLKLPHDSVIDLTQGNHMLLYLLGVLRTTISEEIVQVTIDDDPEVVDDGNRMLWNIYADNRFTGSLEISGTEDTTVYKVKLDGVGYLENDTSTYERSFEITRVDEIASFIEELDDLLGDFAHQFEPE